MQLVPNPPPQKRNNIVEHFRKVSPTGFGRCRKWLITVGHMFGKVEVIEISNSFFFMYCILKFATVKLSLNYYAFVLRIDWLWRVWTGDISICSTNELYAPTILIAKAKIFLVVPDPVYYKLIKRQMPRLWNSWDSAKNGVSSQNVHLHRVM